MTRKQEKLIENFIRMEVRNQLIEGNEQLDPQDIRSALKFINYLAAAGTMRHSVSNSDLIAFYKKLSDLRIEIMRFVEDHSNYTFYGKSPSGFKLVKKK